MRLSSRERFLVLLLALAATAYLAYNFVIKPQLQHIDRLEADLETNRILIAEMKAAEKEIPDLEKKNKDLGKELREALSVYLGDIEQEDVILLIHEILLRSNVLVNEMAFTPFQNAAAGEEGELSYSTMTVSMPFTGSYNDVLSLLSSFWRFDQNIYVSGLEMSAPKVGEETGRSLISGNAQIRFVRVNDAYAANDPIFMWFLDHVYNVSNPFAVRDRDLIFNANYYYVGRDVEFYNEEYVPFSDISGHWAEDVINVFGRNGYIKGNGRNDFNPNSTMSRMEFILLLDRLYRWDLVENPRELTEYNDSNLVATLDPNEYKTLQKSVNNGVVYGFDDNTLRPYDEITYSELEFIAKKLNGDESMPWRNIATSMEEEFGYASPGKNNTSLKASKAEIIYLLYYLNE